MKPMTDLRKGLILGGAGLVWVAAVGLLAASFAHEGRTGNGPWHLLPNSSAIEVLWMLMGVTLMGIGAVIVGVILIIKGLLGGKVGRTKT
jgi:hypothetical protein